MKRVVKANIIMAAFLAVNVVLLIFPLGMLYALGAVLYRYAGVILWILMAVFGIASFIKMYRKQPPSQVLAALGFIGAVIGANTVYREYEDKEFLYTAASVMIWLFVIIPAVTGYMVIHTNIWWLPSV